MHERRLGNDWLVQQGGSGLRRGREGAIGNAVTRGLAGALLFWLVTQGGVARSGQQGCNQQRADAVAGGSIVGLL